ncbi:MAG: hypothetical protein JWN41_1346 [Thermoleophilia bacterium]|nr:hypothetical protein [Thermoleophilia bacterium]
MRPDPGRQCNTLRGPHDAQGMKQPSDSAPASSSDSRDGRRRDHLRLVVEQPSLEAEVAAAIRPRTIGRLIAQTALIAESATNRRAEERVQPPRGIADRFIGRFRSV